MQITTDKSSKHLAGVRVALQVGRVQSKYERWQNGFLAEPLYWNEQSFGKIKDLHRQSVLCGWLSWLLFSLSAVRVLLQYVQWILEGVQHDRNQPGDPGSEHRHWGWEKASVTAGGSWCVFNSLITDPKRCTLCVGVALQVVFGSLYRDDVLIKPSRVVSILAAACMLQLVSAPHKIGSCLTSENSPVNFGLCSGVMLCVLCHVACFRTVWSSSVERPWRKTSVRRPCADSTPPPISMA